MIVYALWHGGASYSPPSVPEDVEQFRSLAAARDALESRMVCGDRFAQDFPYVNRPGVRTACPAVDDDTSMLIYFADPTGSDDPYPDRVLTIGPRGGVREARA